MAATSQTPFPLTGRYAELNKWEILNGPGDARPTAMQVVKDEGLLLIGENGKGKEKGKKNMMSDKAVIVTGVSSGMGPAIVEAMAATGATVFATARNLEKARKALGPDVLGCGRVHLVLMENTDFSSVRKCAADIREQLSNNAPGEKKLTLNIMINNAAVMNTPEERTKDNYELQFATNHLAHFLLFYLLKDLLLEGSTPDFHSRVVNISSIGHRASPIRFDDVHFEKGGYNGWVAYAQSKTANIQMANQIERLYGSQGLHGYSVSPGTSLSPNLQKYCQDSIAQALADERMAKYFQSTEQGASTGVYGAVSKELEGRGGLYLEGTSVVTGPALPDANAIDYGYAPFAFDKESEEKLWELSKKMVGVN